MFGLSRLYIYAISAVTVSAVVMGVFLWVRHQGVIAERERQYKAEITAYQEAVSRANEVSRNLESELNKLRVSNLELSNKLQNELRRDPIYEACSVPSEGMGLLKQAVTKGK